MQKRYKELSEEERKEYHRSKALIHYHQNTEKLSEACKRWREKNKEYIARKQKESKRIKKQKAVEYMGGCCSRCGHQFHPSIYEFHHLDPSTKDKDPSKMLSYSWGRLQEELDKCILLCANCHRLTHHEESY